MSQYFRVPLLGAAALVASIVPGEQASAQDGADVLPPVVVNQPETPATPASKKKKSASSTASTASSSSASGLPDEVPVLGTASVPGLINGVGSTGLAVPLTATRLNKQVVQSKLPSTADTSRLLQSVPGVNVYSAGGVSALPVINGLNDDRVKILVNGMSLTAACANHMNPPLSYVDPGQVVVADVIAGVTPVSKGGDSLGGTVVIETAAPTFAETGEDVITSASISTYYRSNGDGVGVAATASAATENFSISYTGGWSKADNYDRGDDGPQVRSTRYQSSNNSLTLAARDGRDIYVVQGSYENIPYQGYYNQYMDMVDNEAWSFNARALTHHDWGILDVRAFYQHVDHMMDHLEDKPGQMPMYTQGQDLGYSIKAEIPLTSVDVLRIGNEFHRQTLDDWWPPVAGSMMMSPNTYWNINGGERDHLGTFIEWEHQWDRAWSTLLGARNDTVWMDTGDVQAYSDMCMGMGPCDATAAAAFNAKDHKRTDTNFDLTALVRFEPTDQETYEFGYARKTRSPSLYERYAWGVGTMATNMIGWYGDANGYMGNVDLDPEVAHTLSATAAWHDRTRSQWQFKVTPYYTYVEDYIDADFVSNQMSMGMPSTPTGFVTLQFANHDARLYGVNFSGSMALWEDREMGRFDLIGVAGYVNGENLDTGDNLYHMMPINAQLTLAHRLGAWSNAIEVVAVARKSEVNALRNEPMTPGYALVNLRSSYEWENVRLDVGVENLFDQLYYVPLGGVDYSDYKALGGAIGPVAGPGRSLTAGVTVKF